ncbi:C2H2-type zinc finger protein [Massilia sp. X63]|uniref:C2H2-type zinc finger protein n=1 Tax=Massilia sp. X63 TaxID=3237285 RepID=UPI0034DCECCF
MQLSSRLLTQLTVVLQRPARPGQFPSSLWSDIHAQGWAYMHQLEDLVEIMDYRMAQVRLQEFAQAAGCVIRPMRDRPRFKTSSWFSMDMIEAADVAGLCIFLETLGVSVDSQLMVDALYDQVAGKDRLTIAEGEIYCYSELRHKTELTLQSKESVDAEPVQKDWRGAAGHRFHALVRDGQVTSLTVKGPHWRQKNFVEIHCKVCGTRYTKGDPESTHNHRRRHAEVQRLLKPYPSESMRERAARGPRGERVDVNAPLWMHREVGKRALRFKRDFGYDFLQWPSVSTRARLNPNYVGYLFADADGAIDGACAFYCDKGEWRLDWAWIRPERRRHGLLAARWPHFLGEFGDFWIEHPISDDMRGFIDRHATSEQKRLIRVRYPEGSPISNLE